MTFIIKVNKQSFGKEMNDKNIKLLVEVADVWYFSQFNSFPKI